MVRERRKKSQPAPELEEESRPNLDDEILLVDEVTELRGMIKELANQVKRLEREKEKERDEIKVLLERLTLRLESGATASVAEPQGATAPSPHTSPVRGAVPRTTRRLIVSDTSPPMLTPANFSIQADSQPQVTVDPLSSARPTVAPRTLFTPPGQQAARVYNRADTHSTSQPTYLIVSDRDSISKFKAEAPASQPLRRNQEVEGWIRQLENTVKPATDEALIRAARAHCRGQAELIINSPIFDDIFSWDDFKQKLRQKFRGTCSASDFFTLLYEVRMLAGQAPLDFYAVLEGMVYQGYRDHKEAIGSPEELIRRVFLQGLPSWLRELLALKEGDSVQSLVEASQRLWNARVGVSSHDEPPKLPAEPRRSGIAEISRDAPRTYRGSAYQRSTLVCWGCQREGHIRRQCPFQDGQRGGAPLTSGYQRSPRKVSFRGEPDFVRRRTTVDRGCGPDSI